METLRANENVKSLSYWEYPFQICFEIKKRETHVSKTLY